MIIGFRGIEFRIPHSQSLKEKREVLRSIKDRLKKSNLSCAEVGYQDKWQRCLFALVTLGIRRADVDRKLDRVVRMIEDDHRIQVLQVEREYL